MIMPAPTDRQLVTAILDATANLSLRERERKTGISHASFDRWTRGDWKQLQGETRERVVRYLGRAGKMPEPPREALTDAERARLLELVEEMARILRG